MFRRCVCIILATSPLVAHAADLDNNVEWAGLSHIDWRDRDPVCPIDGESFTVSFQTFHYDISAARVYLDDGSPTWIDAQFSHRQGPYDVWFAAIPPTAGNGLLEYYIELTDGTDVDYLGPDGVSDGPPASGWWVDFALLGHAPAGATLTSDGGCVFKVWAPNPSWNPTADWVAVRGDFNNWSCTPLHNLGGGWYAGYVPNVSEWDNYKYYFWDSSCGQNGSNYHEDARYRYVNRSNFDNSVVVDPSGYQWAVPDFTPPPFEEMVIYELHVGTFSGKNDGLGDRTGRYRDVVETHLDHLLDLGVNVVQLMPITEFDGFDSWGYNPINHYAPEEAYGNPYDLKYMIDRLHRNGIAVTLDIVYNHFSGGGNYLWEYGDNAYFDRGPGGGAACDTPWGAQAALWKSEVQDYFAENAIFWLEEYNMDGFRMDATRFMRPGGPFDHGCYPEGGDLMQRINNEIDQRKLQAISIAEELPNSTWITTPTPNGAGFDAQWFDAHTDTLRAAVLTAARLGDPDMHAVSNAINAWGYERRKTVRYVESHDEAGGDTNSDEDRRLSVSLDPGDPYGYWARARGKMINGLSLLSPGIPMILQGGEWFEETKFDAGYDYRLDWAKAAARPETIQFFSDAISIRKANCGMRADAPVNVFHVNDGGNVIGFSRGAAQELVVLANFSGTQYGSYNLYLPAAGTWHEILNSQALEYAGNGTGNGGVVTAAASGFANLTIPEAGLLVLRHEAPLGRSPDLSGDGGVDLHDARLLQLGSGTSGCGLSGDIAENGRIDRGDLDRLGDAMTGPLQN